MPVIHRDQAADFYRIARQLEISGAALPWTKVEEEIEDEIAEGSNDIERAAVSEPLMSKQFI